MENKIKFIQSIEFCDDDIVEITKQGNNVTIVMTSDMANSLLKLEFINAKCNNDLGNYTNASLLGFISYENGVFTLPIEGEELKISCDDVKINDMNEKDAKHLKNLR